MRSLQSALAGQLSKSEHSGTILDTVKSLRECSLSLWCYKRPCSSRDTAYLGTVKHGAVWVCKAIDMRDAVNMTSSSLPLLNALLAAGVLLQDMWQKGLLNKLTLPPLKEFCHRNHLSANGKKADIIERISQHLSKWRPRDRTSKDLSVLCSARVRCLWAWLNLKHQHGVGAGLLQQCSQTCQEGILRRGKL